jgi:hypothetical protein
LTGFSVGGPVQVVSVPPTELICIFQFSDACK